MSQLAAAIGGLYRAFERYPTPRRLEFCDHCRDEEEYQGLLTTPLRQLDADDLDLYVGTALTTCGDVDDFKHFLPRILELMVEADFTSAPEALLDRLALAGWQTWPTEESAAVRAFLAAYWRKMRRDPPLAEPALCGIAQACDDLEPFLEDWVSDTSDGACLARAELVLDAVPEIQLKRRLPNGFWRQRPEQERTVMRWLRTEPVLTGYASHERVVLARQVLVGFQRGASAG
jgi:hypothetical protein